MLFLPFILSQFGTWLITDRGRFRSVAWKGDIARALEAALRMETLYNRWLAARCQAGGRFFGAACWLPLLLDERVVLLLGRIASSFFISRSVGLVRGAVLPAWSDSLTSKPAPAPAAVARGLFLPRVLPSNAPPAAPIVLPTIRVGLVPAQPVNSTASVVAMTSG